MGAESRTNPRRAILWSGTIKSGDIDLNCHIWNVSLGGVLIKAEKKLPEGTPVTIQTENHGSFKGIIAWVGEDALGVKFDDSPEKIDEIFGKASIALGLK